MIRKTLAAYLFFLVVVVGFQAALAQDQSKLTVERIFASSEFQPERFGGFRWLKDGESYAKFEPSDKVKGAFDLVRYGIEDNKRDVLLSADKLILRARPNRLPSKATSGQRTRNAS